MAKATAVCTCEKCGTTFEVRVDGCNRRDADSKAEWAAGYYTLCSDCYQKQQEEATTAENEKKMKEQEETYRFVKLNGTPKQIAAALKEREKAIKDMQKINTGTICKQGISNDANGVFNWNMHHARYVLASAYAFEYVRNIEQAKAWLDAPESFGLIDSRLFADQIRQYLEIIPEFAYSPDTIYTIGHGFKLKQEEKKEEANPQPAKPEPFLLKAEDAIDVECTISITDLKVLVKTSGYSRTITDVMHARKYTWDKTQYVWYRSIGSGNAEDMAAEIGAHLNAANVTCTFPSKEIAQKAIDGTYSTENLRKITAECDPHGNTNGWLIISHEKNDELDSAALSIKGATMNRYQIHVFARGKTEEIRDFAATYGYKISGKAEEVLKKYEATAALGTATVKKMEAQGKSLDDILNSSRDVLEDLKDD